MPATRKRSVDTPAKSSGSLPDDKVYAAFLKSLELYSLGLKTTSSEVQRWALFSAFDKEKKLDRKFTESYSLSRYRDSAFDCEGNFTFTITDKTSKEPVLLRVECVYEAHMHGVGVEPSLADRFVESE